MDALFAGSPLKRRRSEDDAQESSPLKPGTIGSQQQQLLRFPPNAAAAAAAAAAAGAAPSPLLSPSPKQQRRLPPDEFRAMVSAGWDRALRHIPDAVEEAPAQQQQTQQPQPQQQQQPRMAPMQSPRRALLAEHRPTAAVAGSQGGAVDAFAVLRSAHAAQVPMEAQMFLEGRGDGTWAFHWRLAGAPWADDSLPEEPAWSATVKANLPRQQQQHQHAAQAAGAASGSGSSKGGMPTGSVKLGLEVSTNIPPGFGTAVDWENLLLPSNGLGAAAAAQAAQAPDRQQQQQQGTQGFEPAAASAAAAAAAAGGSSMRWRGGGSVVLISALQKSVRRGCAASATKIALELLKDPKGAEALTRRLAVVCLEDGLLHPQLPLVVWTMMALSKGYVIGGHLANSLLTITHQMASMQCRDFMPHDPPSAPAAGVYTAPACWHAVDSALGGPSSQECILVKCMLIRAAYGGMSCDKDMLLAYAGLWTARFSGSTLPPPLLRPAQPPAMHPAGAAGAGAAQPPGVHPAVAAAAAAAQPPGVHPAAAAAGAAAQPPAVHPAAAAAAAQPPTVHPAGAAAAPEQQMLEQQQEADDGQQRLLTQQEQAEAQQQQQEQHEQEEHEQQTLEEQLTSQHGTQQLRPQWLQADAQQQPHAQAQGQEQVVQLERQLLDAAPQEDQQQQQQQEEQQQEQQVVLPPTQLASGEQDQEQQQPHLGSQGAQHLHSSSPLGGSSSPAAPDSRRGAFEAAAAAAGAGAGAPNSPQAGSRSHAPCSSQPLAGGSSSSPAAAAGRRPRNRYTDRAGGCSSSSSSPWLHFLQQQYRQLGPDTVQRVTVVGAVGRADIPLAAVDMHVAPGLTQHLQEQQQLRAAVRSMIASSAAVAARLSAPNGFEGLLNSALWHFRSSVNRKAWLQAQYLTAAAAAAGSAGGQVSRQHLEAAANAAITAWTPVLDPGHASKEDAAAAGAGKVLPGDVAAEGSFAPVSAPKAAAAAAVPRECVQDQDMPDVPGAVPDQQQPTVTLQPGTGFSEGALQVLEMELNALMAHEAQQHATRQELMPLWRAGLATLSDAWCRDYVNRRLY